jgi:hypothetical protein
MIKQLVKDTLHAVIASRPGATQNFKEHIANRLKVGEEVDREFLADVLGDSDPRKKLIAHLIIDLTAKSLQSTDQLLRIASYFDIPSREITTDANHLRTVFKARNQISHEMDVDFTQPNRSRRPRARGMMIGFANDIFLVSSNFLRGVDERIE